uniref:Uncharacterized protein n=1 Tax=Zea mays TaxID=4577 RepID=B6TY48_MAIZE|nr:hypothetical protein [Zea mays]
MAAPAMLQVVILAAVLLLPFLSVPGAEAQTKKFCLTQFAIASQACAILPPTSPEHHHHHHDDEDNDEDNGLTMPKAVPLEALCTTREAMYDVLQKL